MGNFKRQEHGIRVNLTKLDDDIRELGEDYVGMMRLGYYKEAEAIRAKISQLNSMRQDAVKHGYGYYTYRTTRSIGKTMLTLGAVFVVLMFLYFVLVILK